MPIRQDQRAQNVYASNVIVMTNLSCGTSNNRAIYVLGGTQVGGTVNVTSATYAGEALSLLGEITHATNANHNSAVWGLTGITATGSNDVRLLFSSAGLLDGWDPNAIAVTYTDVSSNEGLAFQQTIGATATNSLTSAADRVGVSFVAHRNSVAAGVNGSTGNAVVTNGDSINGAWFFEISEVDPSETSLVMGWTGMGTSNVHSYIIDISPPAAAPAATNVAMVGIG